MDNSQYPRTTEIANVEEDDDRQSKKKDFGKKKDFKKDRRDKGYKMFDEEDSEEELMISDDHKGPQKMKTKHSKPSFKFPKQGKFYKPKEKEKEEKKDKEQKKEEKKKDDKEIKFRLPKKKKPTKQDNAGEKVIIQPIFGVPLAIAVENSKCHDDVQLPAIFRECIDYIEEFGLTNEGIYRISGVKSKVQALKLAYNKHERVQLTDHEPNVVASLLKLYLRELPEPVLTQQLMPKFELASTIKNVKPMVEQFQNLILELPTPNRLLLSWMIVHMTHVISKEAQNKMSLQNVSIVLSPTMQISHRVLNVFFTYSKILFRETVLVKYVPPLRPVTSRWTLELPDSPSKIEVELRKQERLLQQLHEECNRLQKKGKEDESKNEQLWEVQRICTQLKRKLKTAQKTQKAEEDDKGKQNTKNKSSSPKDAKKDVKQEAINSTPEPPVDIPPSEQEQKENSKVATSQKSAKERPMMLLPLQPKKVAIKSEKSDEVSSGKTSETPELSDAETKTPDSLPSTDVETPKDVEEKVVKENVTRSVEDQVNEDEFEVLQAELDQEVEIESQDEAEKGENHVPSGEENVHKAEVENEEQNVTETLPEKFSKIPDYERTKSHEASDVEEQTSIPESQENNSIKQETKHFEESVAESSEDRKLVEPEMEETAEQIVEDFSQMKIQDKIRKAQQETTDPELQRMLLEHAAMMLEEEELIATGDELRKKIETEQREIERLHQEMEELQSIRDEMSYEEHSSAEELSSSEEEGDEEVMFRELQRLKHKNDILEISNKELCEKVHQERQFCLGVKVQIRMIQQQQLCSAPFAEPESLIMF